MKKLILILIALSFVGVCLGASIQDMHRAVIARKTVAASGPDGTVGYQSTICDYAPANTTRVTGNNAATISGTVTKIILTISGTDGTEFEVASFSASGNDLTTNASATITTTGVAGAQEFNAPGDFTAFAINAGEYIGVHVPFGGDAICKYDSAPAPVAGDWYIGLDYIPCTSETFTYEASGQYAIYGEITAD